MNSIKASATRGLLGSVLALAALAAQADTYQFALTGTFSAVWTIDSSPVPYNWRSGEFFYATSPDSIPGQSADSTYFIFSNENQTWLEGYASGPVMSILDYATYGVRRYEVSEQLYTGDESEPTFKLGTFLLTEVSNGDALGSLTITNLSAVPEPASLAMLLTGLGAVGFVAARRREAA